MKRQRSTATDSLERVLEVAVITAAIATVPLIIAQESGDTGAFVRAGDWVVWLIFFAEYAILLALATDRAVYVRRNVLMLGVLILSFPLLPALLGVVRLVRLARLVRLVLVGAKGLRALKFVLGRRGVLYVAASSLFLVLIGGGLMAVLEPETVNGDVGSGLWGAMVTTTTVGYGDIAPTTLWGRLVAVVLMIAGIGLISTLAASVTAYFVGQEQEMGEDASTSPEDLREIRERLARIEELLERQEARRDSTKP